MTAENARFSITTKSGRVVLRDFDSYEQAQRYADKHFVKGCVVTLVGNAVRSKNPVVANALVATNKPHDMPMDVDPDEKVVASIEEFTHQYGKRQMPRPLYTTLDKLHTYLERWGLASREAGIMRTLQGGGKFTAEIPVTIKVVIYK